jgi:hypothetical protein
VMLGNAYGHPTCGQDMCCEELVTFRVIFCIVSGPKSRYEANFLEEELSWGHK